MSNPHQIESSVTRTNIEDFIIDSFIIFIIMIIRIMFAFRIYWHGNKSKGLFSKTHPHLDIPMSPVQKENIFIFSVGQLLQNTVA